MNPVWRNHRGHLEKCLPVRRCGFRVGWQGQNQNLPIWAQGAEPAHNCFADVIEQGLVSLLNLFYNGTLFLPIKLTGKDGKDCAGL